MSALALPADIRDVVLEIAPAQRIRSAMLTAQYPRPLDRAALCIQRV